LLADDAKGRVLTDIVYDDTNIQQMASIPPDAPHRALDLAIVDADEEGGSDAFTNNYPLV